MLASGFFIICEIGQSYSGSREFPRGNSGEIHSFKKGDKKKALVIPLNESDPMLGYLNPPHQPGGRSAGLTISFMVNEDKWLCVTVFDIRVNRNLLTNALVLRLK